MPAQTHIFESWSRESSYLLGLLFADGHVGTKHRHRIEIQVADRDLLEPVQALVQPEKAIETCYRRHGTFYRFRLCGKPIVEAVGAMGLLPDKARLPVVPDEFRGHLLRGVFDGDGSMTLYETKAGSSNGAGYLRLGATISTGSESIAQALVETAGFGKVQSNGGKLGHRCFLARYDCASAVRFLKLIYADSEGLRLARKYERWQDFLDSRVVYRTEVA